MIQNLVFLKFDSNLGTGSQENSVLYESQPVRLEHSFSGFKRLSPFAIPVLIVKARLTTSRITSANSPDAWTHDVRLNLAEGIVGRQTRGCIPTHRRSGCTPRAQAIDVIHSLGGDEFPTVDKGRFVAAQFAHSNMKAENPNPGEAAPLVRLAEGAREAQAASAYIEAHFAAVDERQPSELPFALWLAAVYELEDAWLASPVVSNERKRCGRRLVSHF